jgi:hypothetical protein
MLFNIIMCSKMRVNVLGIYLSQKGSLLPATNFINLAPHMHINASMLFVGRSGHIVLCDVHSMAYLRRQLSGKCM